ncbi:mitochondrial dynamics protein MID49 isoform X1 [Polypterus senegalus]|uniref:mitochondrial dynamics protein MID49 isoform X1 n=1 Tax=Polypterus senegalus TaxID=55291 RepID=UPI0019624F9D|nr:mitochondrial dynamics protein MID49 isoform X1 [Polypterus senegalus]
MEQKGRREGTISKMESTVQKRGKRREDGLGTAVDFLLANARLVLGVGGAAMLGIATLAVKRLMDRAGGPADGDEKPDQKSITESWEELGLVGASPKLLRKELESAVMKATSTPIKMVKRQDSKQSATVESPKLKLKKVQLILTLQEKILQYIQTHVTVAEEEVSHAKQQAMAICTEMQEFIRNKHPDMPLGEMNLGGSLFHDLQVATVSHVCLLLPLSIEEKLWNFIPGDQTILNIPHLWLVRRTSLEYFPRGSSYWDRFTVGGYLSSKLVNETLYKMVMELMNWPSIGSMLDCIIRPVMGNRELKLELQKEQRQLFINIVPTMTMNNTVLTLQERENDGFENLWCQSFYTAENTKLQDLDTSDQGFRRCCLKIFKAICKGNPALRKLTSSHLADTILHLSEAESNWAETDLADRFQQIIRTLVGYMEEGFLPSYFNASVNLLSDLSEEDIDEIGYTLYCASCDPDFLLQR